MIGSNTVEVLFAGLPYVREDGVAGGRFVEVPKGYMFGVQQPHLFDKPNSVNQSMATTSFTR